MPEAHRHAAARLYDAAFGRKLGAAIRDDAARLAVLGAGLDLTRGIAAFESDRLVGLAGIHDTEGSLTGGIGFAMMRRLIGPWRAMRAYAVFALLDRTPEPQELLMDGIVVASDHRGRGIGTGLFGVLEEYAASRGLGRIRLDVVDTNPDARRLYEGLGFEAVGTRRTPYLRSLMGFSASTTMVKDLNPNAS